MCDHKHDIGLRGSVVLVNTPQAEAPTPQPNGLSHNLTQTTFSHHCHWCAKYVRFDFTMTAFYVKIYHNTTMQSAS